MITLPLGVHPLALTDLLLSLYEVEDVRDALNDAFDASTRLEDPRDADEKAIATSDLDRAGAELLAALHRNTRLAPVRPVLLSGRAA